MMTVGTLLIILAIGGFFFLIMRSTGDGCCGGHSHGSHKDTSSGGHRSHHHEKEDTTGHTVKDPVCGMAVAVGSNTPESKYEGQTFYFCSQHCKGTFQEDPERFLPSS